MAKKRNKVLEENEIYFGVSVFLGETFSRLDLVSLLFFLQLAIASIARSYYDWKIPYDVE